MDIFKINKLTVKTHPNKTFPRNQIRNVICLYIVSTYNMFVISFKLYDSYKIMIYDKCSTYELLKVLLPM